MGRVLRESANILVAFALGVVVTLAVVFGTGGLYEYRLIYIDDPNGPDVAAAAINQQGWELLNANPRSDRYFYLRRPRLRLP